MFAPFGTSMRLHYLPLLTVLCLAAPLAGCQVERVDSRDRDPADTLATPAVPNPREVNPPGVDADLSPTPLDDLPEGELIIPVVGVAPDELTDTFTEARGQGRTHDAIDIMAPRGTPVVAAISGEVLRLFESDDGGLTVYKRGDGDDHIYYYAHLDGYHEDLAEGDTVRRGQLIGYVGDTGNAPPGVTHLHFAIWIPDSDDWFWEGEAINPYPILRQSRPARAPAR
jgi:peptidoglycan LD-endopeptidase LytH